LRLGSASEKSSKKIKSVEKIKALDSSPGFFSSHKGYLDKDRNNLEKVIKNVQANTRRPPEVASAMIRRYFLLFYFLVIFLGKCF